MDFPMRVLVIEDSARLLRGLCVALRNAGYSVDTAADGEEGLWRAESEAYDVVVLDIMLPKLDGLSLLRRLRDGDNPVHVLLLTAKDATEERVAGLRAGADDYLVKPFDLDELLARVEALCRRAYGRKSPRLKIGELEIDTLARCARARGQPLALTAQEFALLEYLALRQGEAVSRTDIEIHIYDGRRELVSNAVDVAICVLRRKLASASLPPLIETRRGQGYALVGAQAP